MTAAHEKVLTSRANKGVGKGTAGAIFRPQKARAAVQDARDPVPGSTDA